MAPFIPTVATGIPGGPFYNIYYLSTITSTY